jgi:hypothetical protein
MAQTTCLASFGPIFSISTGTRLLQTADKDLLNLAKDIPSVTAHPILLVPLSQHVMCCHQLVMQSNEMLSWLVTENTEG